MKPHFKPPANHLQPSFNKATRMPILPIILIASLFAGMASASVPLAWQVTPRNPAPVAFDRHHGETLEFRCVFSGFGELPFGQAADIRLWYQTNGMSAAWWSVPVSVSSNVLSATFPPQADPGADRLSLFFGAPSNAYASAVLRLRHSPGFAPNVLPPPDVTSWADELAAIRALIDYSTSNADLVATIKFMAPAPGNYETVSNRAMGAIQAESDPTVPAWAKSPTPPASGLSTNDVCAIVTNEVASGEWKLPDVFNGMELAPDLEWIEEHGDTSKVYYYFDYIRYEGNGVWKGDYQERFGDEDMGWDGDGWGVYGEGSENATRVTFTINGWPAGRDKINATRDGGNALGLSRISDLPQNTPVDELLLNGADGKVYHLRIGAGGSIDIYMEVTP